MTMATDRGPQDGPFADAALDLHQYGLAVIPVGGEAGKTPLVKWAKRGRPRGRDFPQKLIKRFGAENIGVITQLSGVTIIDVDDSALVDTMIRRCGDTPLKISTPSGGVHLWYRHNGERQVIRMDGMKVDIKGVGCFVVVPPSIRPSGVHFGKSYAFLSGSWDDLEHLPKARDGSLPRAEHRINKAEANARSLNAVDKGLRNDTLFKVLLRQARACDDFDTLLDVARSINDAFGLPLQDAEVEKTARSVWRYETSDSIWVGNESQIVTTASELSILMENPSAFTLRCVLQAAHGTRVEPFAVCPKGMANAEVIPGWKWRRYAKARDWLVEHNFLKVVYEGGRGAGDTWQFGLSSPFQEKGASNVPYITKHPPSSPRDDSCALENAVPAVGTEELSALDTGR